MISIFLQVRVQECYVSIIADCFMCARVLCNYNCRLFYSIPQIKQYDIQEFYTLNSKYIYFYFFYVLKNWECCSTYLFSTRFYVAYYIYKYRIMDLSNVPKDYVCIIRAIYKQQFTKPPISKFIHKSTYISERMQFVWFGMGCIA